MHVVCLTGAGISAESGLKTFRDSDGLWAGYRIEDVCTPHALRDNLPGVLDFYNMRRREVLAAAPNAAHFALAELESKHKVSIITQNIDDLHERAGSKMVTHIHGEIFKVRSISSFSPQFYVREDILVGDLAPDGAQMRPHVCFFGETPYDWEHCIELVESADLFLVIGTSLQVYPAAHLVDLTRAPSIVVIDPNAQKLAPSLGRFHSIALPATIGVPQLVAELMA